MNRRALERLEVFVGKWTLDAHFERMPDVEMIGSAEFSMDPRRCLPGHGFTGVSHPQAPDGYSIIAPTPETDRYTQH
jgi:hypothetical protein